MIRGQHRHFSSFWRWAYFILFTASKFRSIKVTLQVSISFDSLFYAAVIYWYHCKAIELRMGSLIILSIVASAYHFGHGLMYKRSPDDIYIVSFSRITIVMFSTACYTLISPLSSILQLVSFHIFHISPWPGPRLLAERFLAKFPQHEVAASHHVALRRCIGHWATGNRFCLLIKLLGWCVMDELPAFFSLISL